MNHYILLIMKYPLVLLSLVNFITSVKLPPTFLKCNRKDADFKTCVLRASKNGLPQLSKAFPELNTPSVEPLLIPEIKIAAGGNTVQLSQYYKNCKLYGLSKSNFTKVDFDFDNKRIALDNFLPDLEILVEYEFDGRVLVLPIVGQGPGRVTLSIKVKRNQENMSSVLFPENTNFQVVFQYDEIRKNGKTYIKIVSSDAKLTPGFMHFRFDNLFNGDKILGDNINKVLNENWEAVFEDIKDGYTELVQKIFASLLNNLFTKVSIEEAFD